ncbi:MAG: NUDIX hydrolase [Oscillospiraceae bacterium]|nr:NUDIX hydrolase [Oscillospiraceae bacterium]
MSYIGEMRAFIGHRPMLTAGATVLVLRDHKLLLNLRSDTNTWGIPGGGLELGETLEQTAARELWEETKLRAEGFTLLHLFSGEDFYFRYPNGDELYSVVALYRAENVSGEPRINDAESRKLKFFGLDALPPLESRAEKIINWLLEQPL